MEMKKTTAALVAFSFIVWSCNNASDNSTTTDSTNHSTDSANTGAMNPGNTPDSSYNNSGTAIRADEASAAFLPEAAGGGLAEVQQGQLAQQKGNNQSVKNFGAMMVHDHTAANDQLKALATRRSLVIPDTLNSKHKKMVDDLSKKSGRDFDKAYMNAMVKDHQEDIKEFEAAEKKVSDTEVKSFISNTLPTLRMHLDSAKAIQKRLK